MTTTQLSITVIVAFVGGGAMGAVINAVVTKYRSRRQPIGYTVENVDVFKTSPDYPSLEVSYTKKSDEMEGIIYGRKVNFLSVARITLVNKGNQDMDGFSFGITLGGTNEAIDVKLTTPDRHHTAELSKQVDLRSPQKEIDFALRPFNRGDEYGFNVYFTYDETPGPIRLTSAHSTQFIETKEARSISIERLFLHPLSVIIFAGVLTLLVGQVVLYYYKDQQRQLEEIRQQKAIQDRDLLRRFNEVLRIPSPSPSSTPIPGRNPK